MPLNKDALNERLKFNQGQVSLNDGLTETANALREQNFVDDATLFGGKSGDVFGGIESLESKVDNAGSTAMGDAMCSFGDEVTGISGVPDPQKVELDLSAPTYTVTTVGDETTVTAGATENQPVSSVVQELTGLGAPVAKLDTQTLGGSSLDAIDATASDATGKSNVLKEKIQGVAAETKAASGTGGGASGGLGAVTDVLKKGADMVKDIIGEVSSIPSINKDAPDLSNVTNNTIGTIDDLKQNVNSVSTPVDGIAGKIINGIDGLSDLKRAQDNLKEFQDRPKIKTGLGLLQDIGEDITKGATNIVKAFSSNASLSDSKTSEIVSTGLKKDQKDKDAAAQEIVRQDTSVSPKMKNVIGTIPEGLNNTEFNNQIEVKATAAGISKAEINATQNRVDRASEAISKLDTTISGTLVTPATNYVVQDVDLKETIALFDNESTISQSFTYIDSKEELGTEFRIINRDINEMIIHATETYTNQNIGAEEIHVEHVRDGEDSIKYHLIIRRDGKLQKGRPINTPANTEGTNGHGINAIEVCLVGGLNCSTGCDDPLSYRSSQSFTREQMSTLEAVCEAFYRRYHGGQIFGHNEIQPLVEDPYFDVSQYVETTFRKKSVYVDLANDTALKSDELITKKPQ